MRRWQRMVFKRNGFSLVELLVVIAIIAVLLGILLVALQRVITSSKQSASQSTMTSFAMACETFALEHGFYPGVVPEAQLAFHNHQVVHGEPGVAISGTENALLHLMGGYVLERDVTAEEYLAYREGWDEFEIITPVGVETLRFKVNPDNMGEGPLIDGKRYEAYFNPRSDQVRVVDKEIGQWEAGTGTGDSGPGEENPEKLAPGDPRPLPDLVDGWGTPILYWRVARKSGPLVGSAHDYTFPRPRFYEEVSWPYTRSTTQQFLDPCSADDVGSLLHSNYFTGEAGGVDWGMSQRLLAQILRGQPPVDDPMDSASGGPRGAFVVISAGEDGVYFAGDDGPGTPNRVIGSSGCGNGPGFPFEEFLETTPKSLAEFDDLVHAAGAVR